jgi:transposase
MRQSRPWIVSDELWSLIEPLLPEPGPKPVEGRPRVPDRQALCGILFVPHTGIQWEYPPQGLGFGSGMTCWRRLVAWNKAGVWDQLQLALQIDPNVQIMSRPSLTSPSTHRAPAFARIAPAWGVDLDGGPRKQVNAAPVDHTDRTTPRKRPLGAGRDR